jgi:hypothetical protein
MGQPALKLRRQHPNIPNDLAGPTHHPNGERVPALLHISSLGLWAFAFFSCWYVQSRHAWILPSRPKSSLTLWPVLRWHFWLALTNSNREWLPPNLLEFVCDGPQSCIGTYVAALSIVAIVDLFVRHGPGCVSPAPAAARSHSIDLPYVTDYEYRNQDVAIPAEALPSDLGKDAKKFTFRMRATDPLRGMYQNSLIRRVYLMLA